MSTETRSTWTAGRAYQRSDDYLCSIYDADRRIIGTMRSHTMQEAQARADKAACAPELAEALAGLLAAHDRYYDGMPDTPTIATARTALAKARGGAS